MKPENTQPRIDAPNRTPMMRYDLERSECSTLAEEPRRALAVLRALELDQNRTGARRLLRFAGTRPRREDGLMVISRNEVSAVAKALRHAGYPLDDGGIERFKEERGYSKLVRIHPEVAAAYTRMIDGYEARLVVDPMSLRRFSTEARRALKLMLLMGRDPQRLMAVRKVLGLEVREPERDGIIPVGKASAKRLLDWSRAHEVHFSDEGLRRIRKATFPHRSTGKRLKLGDLAEPIAQWVIADDEPKHDYTHLTASMGIAPAILNRRTYLMLGRAEEFMDVPVRLRVTRGSYDRRAGKGAHPHQGGGVVDLAIEGASRQGLVQAVKALRSVGFAAWFRPREGNPHIHAICIGDREMSAAAQWQVKSYFQGRDGRSRSDSDPHVRLAVVLPHWVLKYGVRYQ